MPEEENMLVRIPPSTTQEIKWGNVTTVWKNFFARRPRISLIRIARMIAHGIWNRIPPTPMITVFLTATRNCASDIIFTKLSIPTHGLFHKPPSKRKLRNASVIPAIGT